MNCSIGKRIPSNSKSESRYPLHSKITNAWETTCEKFRYETAYRIYCAVCGRLMNEDVCGTITSRSQTIILIENCNFQVWNSSQWHGRLIEFRTNCRFFVAGSNNIPQELHRSRFKRWGLSSNGSCWETGPSGMLGLKMSTSAVLWPYLSLHWYICFQIGFIEWKTSVSQSFGKRLFYTPHLVCQRFTLLEERGEIAVNLNDCSECWPSHWTPAVDYRRRAKRLRIFALSRYSTQFRQPWNLQLPSVTSVLMILMMPSSVKLKKL